MKIDGAILGDVPWPFWVAVIVGGVIWMAKVNGTTVAQAGQAAGGAVVDAAGGVVAGAALGIGDGIGVPRTNETACQQALREGRTWDASFACPAGTFIGSVWGSITD